MIVCTGHGGQDGRGRQVRDQEVSDSGNAALKISFEEQLPVRVIRGSGGDPKWSPPKGYRYDGLYLVSRFWEAYGLDGYKVCRYLLERLEQTKVIEATDGTPADRTTTIVERLLRNSALAQRLKKMYDWTCQMCGTRKSHWALRRSGPHQAIRQAGRRTRRRSKYPLFVSESS